MINDELYMRGADQVLRRVSWRAEIYLVLSYNHEGACGGHHTFWITLQKILLEGHVWPSMQKNVQHWCRSCHECQRMGRGVLKMEPKNVMMVHDVFER